MTGTAEPMSAAPETPAEDAFFASRKDAWTWLHDSGYKVSRGKFYADIQDNGFPVLTDDGRVSRYQVQVYAENLKAAKQKAKTPASIARSDHLSRKEKAEADLAEMKAERARREESEYWLPAADAWSAIAGLMGELRRAVRRGLHEAQNDLALAAGGDVIRAPELFEAADQVVGRAFNETAAGSLDILWEAEP